jgi:hypothetical protein
MANPANKNLSSPKLKKLCFVDKASKNTGKVVLTAQKGRAQECCDKKGGVKTVISKEAERPARPKTWCLYRTLRLMAHNAMHDVAHRRNARRR